MADKPLKIYYVANGRFPNKKAYGIQVAKMCETFIEAGVDLTIVVPRTKASSSSSMREFYSLRVDIPMVTLPAPDWYGSSKAGFVFSSVFFMVTSFFYLGFERLRGRIGAIYTVDMDTFSFALLPLIGPCFAEMHNAKPNTAPCRLFFKLAHGIVATNREIRDQLQHEFGLPPERFVIEPNGVEMSVSELPTKEEARRALSLSPDKKTALYVGLLYPWKGLGVLAETSTILHQLVIRLQILGGTREEFERVFCPAQRLEFAPPSFVDAPMWRAAADVLLLIGTKENDESYRYTAPMKAFEYLASGRPVVASQTPALRSFVPQDVAVFCPPDDPKALASAILRTTEDTSDADLRVGRGLTLAKQHTWTKRAERIIAFMRIGTQ